MGEGGGGIRAYREKGINKRGGGGIIQGLPQKGDE
jgi:hypothetical protein